MLQDLRYAFRTLAKNPGYAFILAAVLALGIGLNTAIFSVTDSVLLRPLPFEQPDRLVEVWTQEEGSDFSAIDLPVEAAWGWAQQGELFQSTSLFREANLVRSDQGEARSFHVMAAEPNLLQTLGRAPLLGRGFSPQDGLAGAPPVVILGYRYWRSQLGGDEAVLGRQLTLDGQAWTVIGILPEGLLFPWRSAVEAWIPLQDDYRTDASIRRLRVVGRLADGVSLQQAQQRALTLAKGIDREVYDEGGRPRLLPVGNYRSNRDTAIALWTLMGSSGLILLIGLFNAAGLMLVRQAQRRRELGIRLAVGASRGQLMRMLLAEVLLVTLAAAAAAVGLAYAGTRLVMAMAPEVLVRFNQLQANLDLRVVSYAFLLSMLSGLLVGGLVALRSARPWSVHFSSLRSSEVQPAQKRARSLLVVAEVALALALLVGAGLLTRSFAALLEMNLGWEPQGVVEVALTLSEVRYGDAPSRESLYRDLAERFEAIPGVRSVALSSGTAISFDLSLQAEGSPPPGDGQPMLVPWQRVEAGYLQTMGIRLIAGRDFDLEQDSGRSVAIVDRPFARYLWGEESPLGRRFRLGEGRDWFEVVGVTDDVRLMGPDDRRGAFDMFLLRRPQDAGRAGFFSLRTEGDAAPVFSHIRQILRERAALQPVWFLRRAEEGIAESWSERRFYLFLMGVFAVTAVLLASLGIYGLLAFSMRLRQREMGVRLAVGARPADVRRLVLASGLRLGLAGTLLGLMLASALSGLMRGLLFSVQPHDPLTLVATASGMLAVTLAAAWLPAQRATRLDPVRVLRRE